MEKVGEIADRKDFSAEQVAKLETMFNAVVNVISKGQREHNQELESSLERIGQALETLKAEKQDSEVRHRHTIDIASSKVFISMITMGLLILGLSFVIGNQRRTIAQFRDKDLKYRYIQMHGEAAPGGIETLETIFTYDRNPDSIRIIRHQVVQFVRKGNVVKVKSARSVPPLIASVVPQTLRIYFSNILQVCCQMRMGWCGDGFCRVWKASLKNIPPEISQPHDILLTLPVFNLALWLRRTVPTSALSARYGKPQICCTAI